MEQVAQRFYVSAESRRDTSLTPEQARALLPKVGDRMRRVPVSLKDQMQKVLPAWCEVVYVNAAHLWYTVQFQEKGNRFRESYKVPEQEGETE